MKIYGIGGLGADERVFQYLDLKYEFIPIDWIEPRKNESIENYSIRVAQSINTNEKFGILGVSFGGLVAVEISKLLFPELTILISSVETKNDLRKIYRLIGKLGILKILPKELFYPPKRLVNWLFGAKKKELLKQILDCTDLKFTKWAVNEFMSWKNNSKLLTPVLKISGSNDKLIPPIKDSNYKIIDKGEHFMIIDRADEISKIINDKIIKMV